MQIRIDKSSGFCSGVIRAIRLAEKELHANESLYCLGEIVHNQAETKRLAKRGLKFINPDEFGELKNAKVLIRAHGVAPEVYALAKQKNIQLIDATCGIVIKLQQQIREAYQAMKILGGQVLIVGAKNHPEVLGLVGQTEQNAIVLEDAKDLEKVDYAKPVRLFSQTTENRQRFRQYADKIRKRMQEQAGQTDADFKAFETICRQVINREEKLAQFAGENEAVIFIGGKNSSNAKVLFEICKKNNPRSYFISQASELKSIDLSKYKTIGLSGATSTPTWLIEEIAQKIVP